MRLPPSRRGGANSTKFIEIFFFEQLEILGRLLANCPEEILSPSKAAKDSDNLGRSSLDRVPAEKVSLVIPPPLIENLPPYVGESFTSDILAQEMVGLFEYLLGRERLAEDLFRGRVEVASITLPKILKAAQAHEEVSQPLLRLWMSWKSFLIEFSNFSQPLLDQMSSEKIKALIKDRTVLKIDHPAVLNCIDIHIEKIASVFFEVTQNQLLRENLKSKFQMLLRDLLLPTDVDSFFQAKSLDFLEDNRAKITDLFLKKEENHLGLILPNEFTATEYYCFIFSAILKDHLPILHEIAISSIAEQILEIDKAESSTFSHQMRNSELMAAPESREKYLKLLGAKGEIFERFLRGAIRRKIGKKVSGIHAFDRKKLVLAMVTQLAPEFLGKIDRLALSRSYLKWDGRNVQNEGVIEYLSQKFISAINLYHGKKLKDFFLQELRRGTFSGDRRDSHITRLGSLDKVKAPPDLKLFNKFLSYIDLPQGEHRSVLKATHSHPKTSSGTELEINCALLTHWSPKANFIAQHPFESLDPRLRNTPFENWTQTQLDKINRSVQTIYRNQEQIRQNANRARILQAEMEEDFETIKDDVNSFNEILQAVLQHYIQR